MKQEGPRRTTICIPTFNQSKYVVQSVDSALSQSVSSDVLVSNDGSSDGTAEVLAKAEFNGRVMLVNHRTNVGIGIHVNWLLQQPATEFIARLDSDDRLCPTYIEELSALLDAHPQAGYAHCSVQEIDDEGREGKVRRLARRGEYEDADSSLMSMVRGYKIAANILLFRRKALEDACFGSPTINFAEDYDLCVRIADAGWGNVYCERVLAFYRVWSNSNRQSVARKMSEIEGLHHIFSTSLKDAFHKRGFSSGILARRRLELALQHSSYLDNGTITNGEWILLHAELIKLAGVRWSKMLFARNGFSAMIRRSYLKVHDVRNQLKRVIKRRMLGR
jgi:glycosyltransferase involved in cell wall biosynthesis